jgi:hypothetical protein
MKLGVLLLALLCSCTAVPAAVPPPASESESARELLRISGIDESLGDWREFAELFVSKRRELLDEEQSAALDGALSAAFDPERLREVIVAQLIEQFDPAAARSAKTWFQSEPGRKIVQLEADAGNPASRDAVSEYAASLRSNPPTAIRIRMVKRFDEASGYSTDLFAIHIAVARSISNAFAPYVAEDERVTPEELEERFERLRPMLTAQTISQVEASMLYATRSLSIVEVAHYVEFVESPAGTWFFSNVGTALVQGVSGAAEQVSAQIPRIFTGEEPPADS